MPWQIDGTDVVIDDDSLSLTPTTLSFSFEVPRDEIEDWREYGRAGDINTEDGYAGTFRFFDRAGRSSATTITPAADDSPPIATTTWWPQSYNEEQLSASRYRVSVSWQRLHNRGDEFGTLSETGDWELATHRGTIGLDESAVAHIPRAGSRAKSRPDLQVILDDDQAGALVDAWSHPGGVVEDEPPDGPNDFRDESPSSRQRVVLTAPDGATVADSVYYVLDWSLELHTFGSRRWKIGVTLVSPTSILESGSATATATPSGSAVGIGVEAGAVSAVATPDGAETTASVESGSVTATATPSGAETTTKREAGSVTAVATPSAKRAAFKREQAQMMARLGQTCFAIEAVADVPAERAQQLEKTYS